MKTYFKDSKLNDMANKCVPDQERVPNVERLNKKIVPDQERFGKNVPDLERFKEYDSENIVEVVTSNISKLSESSGMSLSELARKSGLSKSIVSRIVNGQIPTIEQVVNICNSLGISVESLLRRQDGTKYKDEKLH